MGPYEQLMTNRAQEREERKEQMAHMRRNGCSDQHIADSFGGLSRERVRQILVDVPRPVRLRKPARPKAPTVACALCGGPVRYRGNDATLHLCVAHAKMRSQLWRLIDDAYFDSHSNAVRRQSGRDAPTYSGTWRDRPRRWLNPNSALHQALTAAYAARLPIIQRLPDEVRSQLSLECEQQREADRDVD